MIYQLQTNQKSAALIFVSRTAIAVGTKSIAQDFMAARSKSRPKTLQTNK